MSAVFLPTLTSLSGVSAGFFTRNDPAQDQAAQSRVLQALGADALALCKQVHGTTTLTVDESWSTAERPEADALVTRRKGIALGILTADCAPILLADAQAGVIGAAHAGWRGALGGVLESVVEAMEGQGAMRSRICAAIGPCIGQDSYEVGEDFRADFLAQEANAARFFKPSARAAHFLFDLPDYVRARLLGLGLAEVTASPADTLRDEARFFSHRRGTLCGVNETGRMLSCIALKEIE